MATPLNLFSLSNCSASLMFSKGEIAITHPTNKTHTHRRHLASLQVLTCPKNSSPSNLEDWPINSANAQFVASLPNPQFLCRYSMAASQKGPVHLYPFEPPPFSSNSPISFPPPALTGSISSISLRIRLAGPRATAKNPSTDASMFGGLPAFSIGLFGGDRRSHGG